MTNGVVKRGCSVQYGEGLQVMILGMGLVFMSLIIIMFVMMGLQRAFPYRSLDDGAETTAERVEAVGPAASAAPAAPPRTAEGEVALAIVLAVARARAAATPKPSRRFAPVAACSAEQAALRWDWLWDAGVDDYGTAKGSTDADFRDNC